MCSNYRPVTRADRLLTFFGVERDRDDPSADVYLAPMIVMAPDDGTTPSRMMALQDAIFRFVPDFIAKVEWARRTYNASGALLTVRSGKSACSHDLVTVSCGSGRSDCLNWRQRPSAEVRQGPVNDGSAATAVGRGRGVGSRSLAQSRHRLTQQRGGINDRYRKGCSHPAKQSTGCPAKSRSNVRCTKGRTHAQSQDTAVVQSQ